MGAGGRDRAVALCEWSSLVVAIAALLKRRWGCVGGLLGEDAGLFHAPCGVLIRLLASAGTTDDKQIETLNEADATWQRLAPRQTRPDVDAWTCTRSREALLSRFTFFRRQQLPYNGLPFGRTASARMWRAGCNRNR